VWFNDPQNACIEPGSTNSFNLDPRVGLYVSDIHSVKIHKSPDGLAGGWKLKGIRIIVNENTIYDNQSIDTWLVGDSRTWSANIRLAIKPK